MKELTLREVIKNLQNIARHNPDLLDKPVISSSDDEGNSYNYVYYTATPLVIGSDLSDVDGPSETVPANTVCIN